MTRLYGFVLTAAIWIVTGGISRLRTLYAARCGVILRGSEVSDAQSVSALARPDAPHQTVVSEATWLASRQRSSGHQRDRLRDPPWPAMERRAACLRPTQDAV